MQSLLVAERQQVLSDIGDTSKENEQWLEAMGRDSWVIEKGYRNKPLAKFPTERNKAISQEGWLRTVLRWMG